MSELNILTLTWNMSGEDTSRSVKAWKASEVGKRWSEWLRGRMRTNEALEHGIGTFDVVVLCLQEVHRKSEFGEFFLDELNSSLQEAVRGFNMAGAKNKSLTRLAGESFDQHIYVFYRPENGFSVAKRGSTCFGAGGTCVKGSVGIHLHRKNEHYLFVCSHFPFAGSEGDKGDLARTAAYHRTKDKLIKELRTIGGATAAMDKVTIVWAGDFNYRTDLIKKELKAAKQGDRYSDRLSKLRFTGDGPWPFNEHWRECDETKLRANFKPNYQPTCRMVQLSQGASLAGITAAGSRRHEGMKEAYSTKRQPAWCDRVFIKPLNVRQLSCKSNKFSTGSVESDHDAVFAELTLKGVAIGESITQGLIEEWHDFTDEFNQSNESEMIAARLASIDWKAVLREHAQLIMERNEAIAEGKDEAISDLNGKLTANTGRWKMVRANNTEKLQREINSYNVRIAEVMRLRPAADTAQRQVYLDAQAKAAEVMFKILPEFLAKRVLRKRRERQQALWKALGDYDFSLKFHVDAVHNRILSLKMTEAQRETLKRELEFQTQEVLRNADNVADLFSKHGGFLSEEMEESLLQSDESEPIEAIISSSDWIKVLQEHSTLIIRRSMAVASRWSDIDERTKLLNTNAELWKLFRPSSTRDLQRLVKNLNNTLLEVAEALAEGNTGKHEGANQTLNVNVKQLVEFLIKHKPLGSSVTLADYRAAFTTYARCLSDHASAEDKVARTRSEVLFKVAVKRRDELKAECDRVAFRVAKVMKGEKWEIRLSDEADFDNPLVAGGRVIVFGHFNGEIAAARVMHKKLHAMQDAMKPGLEIRKKFLTVLPPLINEVVDAIDAWSRALGDHVGKLPLLFAFAFALIKSLKLLAFEMVKKKKDVSSYITWIPIQKDIVTLMAKLHDTYHF